VTPAARRLLAEEHARQLVALRPVLAKIRQLEIELQHMVFDVYGLTPDEVQLLRSAAPQRDRLMLVEAGASSGHRKAVAPLTERLVIDLCFRAQEAAPTAVRIPARMNGRGHIMPLEAPTENV
jgi:predicted amino acid dehydrogenase